MDAGEDEREEITSALLLASRALVAIAARSLDDLEDQVTLEQHRALVVLTTRGPQNLTALAGAVGVTASTGNRLVNRLIDLKLVQRTRSSDSGREVVVALTRQGRRTVTKVMERRRREIAQVVDALSPDQRRGIVDSLNAFAEASGEPPEQSWALGWGSEPGTRATRPWNHSDEDLT